MYIVMRTYDLILGTREEFIQHVQERLVPLLNHVPGYRAFSLAEAGDNNVTFISTFDTLADAKASARLTRGWIAEHTEFFIQEVTKVAAGQLRVHNAPVRLLPTIQDEEERQGLFGYAH